MAERGDRIRLLLPSDFDYLDVIESIGDRAAVVIGLDEDARHWVAVAIRESVINAVKHGNREDVGKLVEVEFTLAPADAPSELVIRVCDQGEGFDPDDVGDPRDPINLLKASGRGIFFMRSFMDDVVWRRRPEGGMEVRMVKKRSA
jgi:serine/threonine-protein kinase RsbW